MTQLALIPQPPAPPALTDRQKHALLTVSRLQPVTADEIGAELCAHRGKHPADRRCEYDALNGNSVLRSLRKKKLVQHKRGSGWVLAGYSAAMARESSQGKQRPGFDSHGLPIGF